MTRNPEPFERCSKQEAGNALRNAAEQLDAAGPKMIQFGIVGSTDRGRQTLNQAIIAVATAHDQGWHKHPSGYNLIVSVGPKVIRYNVQRRERPQAMKVRTNA